MAFARPVAAVRFAAFGFALVSCGLVVSTQADMADATNLWQLSSFGLERFNFEGVPMGAQVTQLKQKLPAAQFAYDRVDAQVGVDCYTVTETKTADGACFYFFHGSLYQMDIEYRKPRVEAAGGMAVLIHELIDVLGPADHADIYRRSWYEPNCSRRADFYVSEDRALLVITDVSRGPQADRRLRQVEPTQPIDLGLSSSDARRQGATE